MGERLGGGVSREKKGVADVDECETCGYLAALTHEMGCIRAKRRRRLAKGRDDETETKATVGGDRRGWPFVWWLVMVVVDVVCGNASRAHEKGQCDAVMLG